MTKSHSDFDLERVLEERDVDPERAEFIGFLLENDCPKWAIPMVCAHWDFLQFTTMH